MYFLSDGVVLHFTKTKERRAKMKKEKAKDEKQQPRELASLKKYVCTFWVMPRFSIPGNPLRRFTTFLGHLA